MGGVVYVPNTQSASHFSKLHDKNNTHRIPQFCERGFPFYRRGNRGSNRTRDLLKAQWLVRAAPEFDPGLYDEKSMAPLMPGLTVPHLPLSVDQCFPCGLDSFLGAPGISLLFCVMRQYNDEEL